jgi:hypothetical protein
MSAEIEDGAVFADKVQAVMHGFVNATVALVRQDPGFNAALQGKWFLLIAESLQHEGLPVEDQTNERHLRLLLIRAVCEQFIGDGWGER